MKVVSCNTILVISIFTGHHKFISVLTQIQINFIIFHFKNNNTKVPFLREAETAIRLAIKSWFADVGLSTSDCIWGLLFLY